MECEQIICVADGRMHYEAFRGKWKNIMVRDRDGTMEPLAWYDAARYEVETPAGEYFPDHDKFRALLEERFAGKRIDTALLINTFGGRVGTEQLMREITDFTRKSGGKVFSYVTTVAVSAGSEVMMQADEILTLPDTWCMWHLPDFSPNFAEELRNRFGSEKGAEKLQMFNKRRHEMHEEKLQR